MLHLLSKAAGFYKCGVKSKTRPTFEHAPMDLSSASLPMHIAIGTVWMKSVTQKGAHSQRVEPGILLGQYSETAAGAKA